MVFKLREIQSIVLYYVIEISNAKIKRKSLAVEGIKVYKKIIKQ